MAAREFRENESCLNCGRTDGKTLGKSLCVSCYQKLRRQSLKLQEEENENNPDITIIPDEIFEEDLGNSEIRPGAQPDPVETSNEEKSEESLTDKFKNFFNSNKEKNGNAPKTKEKRPSSGGRRVSGAQSIGDLYGAIGGFISRNPRHRPSGLLLQWQAAAAGEIIDEAVKDTAIDKIFIQRAVKARGRLDMVGAVLFPPAIVFAIEMNPNRAPMLLPLLESTLRNSLPHMVPAIKKARKREEDQAEAIRELFPEAEPGIDPVQELINELFSGWYPSNVTEEEMESEYGN